MKRFKMGVLNNFQTHKISSTNRKIIYRDIQEKTIKPPEKTPKPPEPKPPNPFAKPPSNPFVNIPKPNLPKP